MDPDLAPHPAILVIDLQDANKTSILAPFFPIAESVKGSVYHMPPLPTNF
jgi:hypothetical protein